MVLLLCAISSASLRPCRLARIYGGVFRLCFGPKRFVVVSDAAVARHILLTNASRYSKGILSEILDFVMGQGLIPADGTVWQTRRRAIVPSLHKCVARVPHDMLCLHSMPLH